MITRYRLVKDGFGRYIIQWALGKCPMWHDQYRDRPSQYGVISYLPRYRFKFWALFKIWLSKRADEKREYVHTLKDYRIPLDKA